MNLISIAGFFISAISFVVILYFGKSILIPFVFALLLWFIVRQLRKILDKIPIIGPKIPVFIKNILSLAFIIVLLDFAISIIVSNINLLAATFSNYTEHLIEFLREINHKFDINIASYLISYLQEVDLANVLLSIFKISTDILSSVFMVLIYGLFLFFEEKSFQSKIEKLINGNINLVYLEKIISNIENAVSKYLGLKSAMSLTTGLLSYFVLLIIGVDFPAFWAFIIFILNFIPTIGSLIATLLPALFSLLQFGELLPALTILLFVGAIQVLIGNIIEPKLMGNSMNISPLVTIAALSFWGAIWGITGMILSVPIMVIIVIILSQFPQTRPIAIMLSEKGNLNDGTEESLAPPTEQ